MESRLHVVVVDFMMTSDVDLGLRYLFEDSVSVDFER